MFFLHERLSEAGGPESEAPGLFNPKWIFIDDMSISDYRYWDDLGSNVLIT